MKHTDEITRIGDYVQSLINQSRIKCNDGTEDESAEDNYTEESRKMDVKLALKIYGHYHIFRYLINLELERLNNYKGFRDQNYKESKSDLERLLKNANVEIGNTERNFSKYLERAYDESW